MIKRLQLQVQRQGKCDLCKSVTTLAFDFIVHDDVVPDVTPGTLHTCKHCATALSHELGQDPPPDAIIEKEFFFEV